MSKSRMTTTEHPLRARPFPIQRGEAITWAQAEWGYRCYAALYGTEQSLNRLAERGGFGEGEIRLCAQHVIERATRRPELVSGMRYTARDLPRGERTPGVEAELAEKVEAILDGEL